MFTRHGVPRSRLEALGRIPLFEGLSEKVLARIDKHLDELQVQPGRELTTQGRGAYEAFIVEEGEAEVTIDGKVVGRAGPGELIGELGVLEHRLRSATVKAATPMRLLVMDSRDVRWLFEDATLAARVQENIDRHRGGGPDPEP